GIQLIIAPNASDFLQICHADPRRVSVRELAGFVKVSVKEGGLHHPVGSVMPSASARLQTGVPINLVHRWLGHAFRVTRQRCWAPKPSSPISATSARRGAD